jgi:hypothetical protein
MNELEKESIVSEQNAAIERIGRIARQDPCGRGLSGAATPFPLREAAAELLSSRRVVLLTGFCVRAAMVGETDGPPGTLSLAVALDRLGAKIALVTDAHSAGLLSAASAVYGVSFPTTVLTPSHAVAQLDELAASFSPTHVVAIERPGSAADGHRYSMRGEILDDIAPAADRLFESPESSELRRWKTIAVGDGGNELGMGSLRESLQGRVKHGPLIFCATRADFALAVGISNWGAYALAAAVSLLAGRLLLAPLEKEREVMEALLAAGAVDGCTKSPSLSVDGLPWECYFPVLTAMYAEAHRGYRLG